MATDYTLGKIKVEFSSMGAESTTKDISEVKRKIDSITKSLERFNQLDLSHITKISNDIKNLDLSNLEKINNTTKNINTKGINEFANALTKLQTINTSNFNLDGITSVDFSGVAKIGEPFKGIGAESMNNFSNSLNKLQNLSFNNLDIESLQAKFADLAVAVKPFVNELAKAEKSLVAMDSVIKKVANGTKKASNNAKDLEKNSSKSQKNFSKLFSIGKLYFFLNYTKKIAQGIGGMVTKAIDFEETLNKFQVSMGSHYQQSLKFVNDLTTAFNLSRESIMNYQSTFKNMLDALGNLDTDVTYKLSETLTRMAIDYSSLYNVQVERAMEQFQGVLSGNIRSIRSTSGYDVSEQTIFNIYRGLGGTKTMRQLDQVEKRLLRIIALQQQMERTGAVGDFEKTMTNTSNVLKQIQDTLKEIGTWIGSIMKIWVAPLLEKVLGFLLAVKEIVKTLSILSGYKYEDFGSGGLFGDIEQGAEDAKDSVNSLKRVLLGFDQLNILGSSTSNEQLTADYSYLTDKIKEYNSQLDQIENKYAKISETILQWAGFTYDAEKEIWEYVGSEKTSTAITEFIFTKINDLIGKITIKIAEGFGKIFEKLPEIIEIIFNVLKENNVSVGLVLEKILDIIANLIISIIELLPSIIDDITILTQDISGKITDIIVEIIKTFAKKIPDLVDSIIKFIFSLISSTSVMTTEVIFDIIEGVVEAILSLIEGIIRVIPRVINNVDDPINLIINVLIGVIPKLIESIINIVITIFDMIPDIIDAIVDTTFGSLQSTKDLDVESIFKTIGTVILNITKSILKLIITLIYKIIELPFRIVAKVFNLDKFNAFLDKVFNLDTIISTIKNLFKKIGDWFLSLFQTISDFFTNTFNKIKQAFIDIKNIFEEDGLSGVIKIAKITLNSILNKFKSTFNKIKDFFSSIGETISKLWEKIKSAFENFVKILKLMWQTFFNMTQRDTAKSIKLWESIFPKLAGTNTKSLGTISTFTPTTASTTSGVSASNYASANQQATNQNKMLATLTNAIITGTKQVVNSVNNSGNNPIYLDNTKVSKKVSSQLGKILYQNLRTIV